MSSSIRAGYETDARLDIPQSANIQGAKASSSRPPVDATSVAFRTEMDRNIAEVENELKIAKENYDYYRLRVGDLNRTLDAMYKAVNALEHDSPTQTTSSF